MSLSPTRKLQMDRNLARQHLGSSEDYVRALRLVFGLRPGQAVKRGQRGNTKNLTSLARKKAQFVAQGVAGILVGETYVRPVEAPCRNRRRGEPFQLGPVTLSRPALQLLAAHGHAVKPEESISAD